MIKNSLNNSILDEDDYLGALFGDVSGVLIR
jgi:hypothetical protein